MRKQKGYIDTSGFAFFFFFGLVAMAVLVLMTPIVMYDQYQAYKEESKLISDCERGLPREKRCVIVKIAKLEEQN
jgi:hypothetical protein